MGTGSRAPGTVGRYHGNFQSTFFEEDIGKHLSISSCKFPTRMWQHSSHLLHRQRTSIKNLNGIVFSSQFDFILFAVRTWISCIYIFCSSNSGGNPLHSPLAITLPQSSCCLSRSTNLPSKVSASLQGAGSKLWC